LCRLAARERTRVSRGVVTGASPAA
jgi:hypothetical protein